MTSLDIMDDKFLYEKESSGFLQTLLDFHRSRGTPLPRLPTVGGRRIDLFKLYNTITELGGWTKVNSTLGWEDLLSEFGIPPATGNGSQALKLIYARHLWPYEKQKRGEDVDDEFKEVDGERGERSTNRLANRSRRQALANNPNGPVPLAYNQRQHELAESTRALLGLPPAPSAAFRPVIRSLSSALPNEVDFGLNVCGVLSAESQSNPLSLSKAAGLLPLLLSHAGIYSSLGGVGDVEAGDDAGFLVAGETVNAALGRNFWRFWMEATEEFPVARKFVLPGEEEEEEEGKGADEATEKRRETSTLEAEEELAKADEEEASSEKGDATTASTIGAASNDAGAEAVAQTNALTKTTKTNPPPKINDLRSLVASLIPSSAETALGVARPGGARDVELARVSQILAILRNLSFDEENRLVMAADKDCLRFIFLCIHSKYSDLSQMGLDAMANLATKLALDECGCKTTQLLFEMLHRLLHSEDRFQILRGLEILGALAAVDSNEEVLLNAIGGDVFARIAQLLTVTDLQILVGSLDCLYRITNSGAALCSLLMTATTRILPASSVPSNCPFGAKHLGANRLIRQLVNFLTLEASSLGPTAVSSIRVVEIRPVADHQSQRGLLPTPYQQTNYMYTANAAQAQPTHVAGQVEGVVPPAASAAAPHYVIQHPGAGRNSPLVIIPQCGNALQVAGSQVGAAHMIQGQPTAITVKGGQVIPVVIYQPKQQQQPQPHQPEPTSKGNGRVDINGEEFARNWLVANYEAGTSNEHIARNALYQAYSDATRAYGLLKNESVTSGAITKLVNVLWPSVVVRRIDDGSGQQLHHGGLRKKAVPSPMPPLPPKHQPTTAGPATIGSTPARQILTVSTQSQGSHSSGSAQSSPALSTSQVPTEGFFVAGGRNHLHSGQLRQQPHQLQQPQQAVNEVFGLKNPAGVQSEKTRDSNLIKSLLASKLTTKIENPGNSSPRSDVSIVATALHQRQPQQQPLPQPAVDSTFPPNSLKTYARGATKLPAERHAINHSNDVGDAHSDACSEDSRHSVTSMDSGKGSTVIPSTSVSPESHPVVPTSQPGSTTGACVEEAPAAAVPVKFESTLVKKMLAGVVDDSASSALETVVKKESFDVVVNGHPETENESVVKSEEDSTNAVRVNGVAETNGTDVDVANFLSNGTGAVSDQRLGAKRSLDKNSVENGEPSVKAMKVEPESVVNGDVVVAETKAFPNQGRPLVSSSTPPSATPDASASRLSQPHSQTTQQPSTPIEQPLQHQPHQNLQQTQQQLQHSQQFSQRQVITQTAPSGATIIVQHQQQPPTPSGMCSTAPPRVFGAAAAAGPNSPSSQSESCPSSSTTTSAEYFCEWSRCARVFRSPKTLFHHVCTDHVNSRFKEGNCLWGACDSMRRKRWSLVSHLQDRHCNEQALKLAALRRQHRLKFGAVPSHLRPPAPAPHPGYAPNAAMLAIKRHSHLPPLAEFASEQEGPVTRDIRLTAAIVLKNLARHCEAAQRLVLRHERRLASVAFRCMEASNNVAQCLAHIPAWMRGSKRFDSEIGEKGGEEAGERQSEEGEEDEEESPEVGEASPERSRNGMGVTGGGALTATGTVRGVVEGEVEIREANDDDDESQTIVIATD